MKRTVVFLLLICLVFLCLPQTANANAPGPNLDGSYDRDSAFNTVIIGINLIMIVFTCVVEWLVCIPFKLHYVHTKVIITTNIITQMIMHILEWLMMVVLPTTAYDAIAWYIFTVSILEIAVIISEFLIYRKKILGLSAQSRLFYVLSANAASTFGGIVLLLMILL